MIKVERKAGECEEECEIERSREGKPGELQRDRADGPPLPRPSSRTLPKLYSEDNEVLTA